MFQEKQTSTLKSTRLWRVLCVSFALNSNNNNNYYNTTPFKNHTNRVGNIPKRITLVPVNDTFNNIPVLLIKPRYTGGASITYIEGYYGVFPDNFN